MSAEVQALPVGIEPGDMVAAALLNAGVPTSHVLELLDDTDAMIDDIQRQFDARMAPLRRDRERLRIVIDAKMRANKATIAKFDTGDAVLEAEMVTNPVKPIVNAAELMKLYEVTNPDGSTVVPLDELQQAVRIVPQEPVIKTHLTYLKKLDKYGVDVQAVLARGIVQQAPGAPQLVIRRKPKAPALKNVTDSVAS